MADSLLGQKFMQIIDTCDWTIIEADDDVAFANTCISRRAIFFERHDKNATLNFEIVEAYYSSRDGNVLSRQADITATNFPIANQSPSHILGSIDRRGKANSLSR